MNLNDVISLIPALLPAQLKRDIGELRASDIRAHSGFIAGSIETQVEGFGYYLKEKAHSGFIAGSIETDLKTNLSVVQAALIPALLPAQLKLGNLTESAEMAYAHSGFIAGSIETSFFCAG